MAPGRRRRTSRPAQRRAALRPPATRRRRIEGAAMLYEHLAALGKWNWLILAAIFFVLELIAPGAFMLWLGISATLVGIILFFAVWSWQMQLVAFAVFALI